MYTIFRTIRSELEKRVKGPFTGRTVIFIVPNTMHILSRPNLASKNQRTKGGPNFLKSATPARAAEAEPSQKLQAVYKDELKRRLHGLLG